MTSAVANAIAISLDKQARSAWDRQVALEDQQAGPAQTLEEFAQTLARIQAAAPGAVKVH